MNALEGKPVTIRPLPSDPFLLVLLSWGAAAQPQPDPSLSCSRVQDSILLMFLRSSKLAPTGRPASFLATSGPTSSKWQPSWCVLSMMRCASPKSSTEETWINTQFHHCWHCGVAVHEVIFPWIQTAGQRWSSGSYSQAQIPFSSHTSNSAWKELTQDTFLKSSCLTYESWGLVELQRDRYLLPSHKLQN